MSVSYGCATNGHTLSGFKSHICDFGFYAAEVCAPRGSAICPGSQGAATRGSVELCSHPES